jgi:hypothetical protein
LRKLSLWASYHRSHKRTTDLPKWWLSDIRNTEFARSCNLITVRLIENLQRNRRSSVTFSIQMLLHWLTWEPNAKIINMLNKWVEEPDVYNWIAFQLDRLMTKLQSEAHRDAIASALRAGIQVSAIGLRIYGIL